MKPPISTNSRKPYEPGMRYLVASSTSGSSVRGEHCVVDLDKRVNPAGVAERRFKFIGSAQCKDPKCDVQLPSGQFSLLDILSMRGIGRAAQTNATRLSVGKNSLSSSSRLPVRSANTAVKPVRFPPGRARLVTTPVAIGSMAATITIGISSWRPVPAALLACRRLPAHPRYDALSRPQYREADRHFRRSQSR